MADILMPQLGETVAEGTVSSWFKSVGDAVAIGDKLFEIETDKVAMAIEATEAGVLAEIRVPAGQTVPVSTVVAVIAAKVGAASKAPAAKPVPSAKTEAARTAAAPAAPAAPRKASPPVAAPQPRANGATKLDPFFEVRTPTGRFGPAKGPLDLRVTPLARRLIVQNRLDMARIAEAVKARGGWRIGKDDVLQALETAPAMHLRPAPAADAPRPREAPTPAADAPRPREAPKGAAGDRIVPLNRVRKRTAEHLAYAWTSIPHVAQGMEVDFSRIARLREKAKDAFRQRFGVGLTYLPFIARAVCLAIRDYPKVNARLDNGALLVRGDVHLGIAIDLDHEGLVVPVLHNADGLTVAGLAKAIDRAAQKARAGTLMPGDFEDGTYTITNNGGYGTLFTTPIINAPQVAILSTDAIRRRPLVVEDEDGERVAIRPLGNLTQSFDHRAFDGAYAASFLARVKSILETRDWTADLE
jgi:pyruvate dehydrogenase E2 component (dihydrolipoamide acetyltransferase)